MYKSDRKWRLQHVKEQIQECLEGFKFMTNNEENRNALKEEVEDIIDDELCSMTMDYPNVVIKTNPDNPTEISIEPADEFTEKLMYEIYNS